MKVLEMSESISEKIRKILTFRFLSESELKELVKISKIEQYKEDEKIIGQGELNQSFYAIIDGTVKVTVHEKNQQEAYICTIGNGEIYSGPHSQDMY